MTFKVGPFSPGMLLSIVFMACFVCLSNFGEAACGGRTQMDVFWRDYIYDPNGCRCRPGYFRTHGPDFMASWCQAWETEVVRPACSADCGLGEWPVIRECIGGSCSGKPKEQYCTNAKCLLTETEVNHTVQLVFVNATGLTHDTWESNIVWQIARFLLPAVEEVCQDERFWKMCCGNKPRGTHSTAFTLGMADARIPFRSLNPMYDPLWDTFDVNLGLVLRVCDSGPLFTNNPAYMETPSLDKLAVEPLLVRYSYDFLKELFDPAKPDKKYCKFKDSQDGWQWPVPLNERIGCREMVNFVLWQNGLDARLVQVNRNSYVEPWSPSVNVPVEDRTMDRMIPVIIGFVLLLITVPILAGIWWHTHRHYAIAKTFLRTGYKPEFLLERARKEAIQKALKDEEAAKKKWAEYNLRYKKYHGITYDEYLAKETGQAHVGGVAVPRGPQSNFDMVNYDESHIPQQQPIQTVSQPEQQPVAQAFTAAPNMDYNAADPFAPNSVQEPPPPQVQQPIIDPFVDQSAPAEPPREKWVEGVYEPPQPAENNPPAPQENMFMDNDFGGDDDDWLPPQNGPLVFMS